MSEHAAAAVIREFLALHDPRGVVEDMGEEYAWKHGTGALCGCHEGDLSDFWPEGRDALVKHVGAAMDALVARAEEAERELADARHFIGARGYRRCDMPACNCGSWHGGHAMARLNEISEAIGDHNGVTILDAVLALRRERDEARADLDSLQEYDAHGDGLAESIEARDRRLQTAEARIAKLEEVVKAAAEMRRRGWNRCVDCKRRSPDGRYNVAYCDHYQQAVKDVDALLAGLEVSGE